MNPPAQSSENDIIEPYFHKVTKQKLYTEKQVNQKIVEELERLENLPNVYPEKIDGMYTHVQAIYKSAITERINQLKGGN